MSKVQVRGYQRAKPAKKPQAKGYATGGLVQERIDSGAGPNWTNSVGYADPSQQYASAAESMRDEFKGMRGPKLKKAMERQSDDLANLANLKARADNFEKTGLAPWDQPRQAVAGFAPREPGFQESNTGVDPLAAQSQPAVGSPAGMAQTLGLDSMLNYQDSGPGNAPPPAPVPEDEPYQMGFQQRQRRPVGSVLGTSSLLGMQRGGTIDYRRGGTIAGGPPGVDTVPVVARPGGPTKAMMNNGEYALPDRTVNAVGGKPALDELVLATTGQPPVGYGQPVPVSPQGYKCGGKVKYGLGGAMDLLRGRAKQIDAQVDQTAQGRPMPAPVPQRTGQQQPMPAPQAPTPGTGLGEIMREIRAKNPPVQGYAQGGLPVVDPAAQTFEEWWRQSQGGLQQAPKPQPEYKTGPVAAEARTTTPKVQWTPGDALDSGRAVAKAQPPVMPMIQDTTPRLGLTPGDALGQAKPAVTPVEMPAKQYIPSSGTMARAADAAGAAREMQAQITKPGRATTAPVRPQGFFSPPGAQLAPVAPVPSPPGGHRPGPGARYGAGTPAPAPAPTPTPRVPPMAPSVATAAPPAAAPATPSPATASAAPANAAKAGVLSRLFNNPVVRFAGKMSGPAMALDPSPLGDATIGGALLNMDDVALQKYVAEVPEDQRANALTHYTALRDQARKTQGLDPMLTQEQQALVDGRNSGFAPDGTGPVPPGATSTKPAAAAPPPDPTVGDIYPVSGPNQKIYGDAVLTNQGDKETRKALGVNNAVAADGSLVPLPRLPISRLSNSLGLSPEALEYAQANAAWKKANPGSSAGAQAGPAGMSLTRAPGPDASREDRARWVQMAQRATMTPEQQQQQIRQDQQQKAIDYTRRWLALPEKDRGRMPDQVADTLGENRREWGSNRQIPRPQPSVAEQRLAFDQQNAAANRKQELGLKQIDMAMGQGKDQAAQMRQWDDDFGKAWDAFKPAQGDGLTAGAAPAGVSPAGRAWGLEKGQMLKRLFPGLSHNEAVGRLYEMAARIPDEGQALAQVMAQKGLKEPTPEARAEAAALVQAARDQAELGLQRLLTPQAAQ